MTIMNHVAECGRDNILCCHFNDDGINVFFLCVVRDMFPCNDINNVTGLFEIENGVVCDWIVKEHVSMR